MAKHPRDDDEKSPIREEKPKVKDEPLTVDDLAADDKPTGPEKAKTIEDHGIGAGDPYPTGGAKE